MLQNAVRQGYAWSARAAGRSHGSEPPPGMTEIRLQVEILDRRPGACPPLENLSVAALEASPPSGKVFIRSIYGVPTLGHTIERLAQQRLDRPKFIVWIESQ